MSPSPIGGQRPPLRHSVVKGQWQNATDNASHPKSKIENPKFLEGHYVLTADNHMHFAIPSYDKTRALVIDPVLDYSTYLGGTGGDVALGIAVDSAGNAIIGGMTNSSDFPVKNGASGGYRGSGDAFISKFDFVSGTGTGTGLTMVYSTYLGGSGTDSAASIAVDASDDVFITGPTTSTDFPITPTVSGTSTTSAFQTTYGGNGDAFVTELASAGDSLVYSSYLGGAEADFGQGIAVDGSGNAYVTGSTQSANFPTVTPLQATKSGGSDAFVAKVNFGGTQLLYSTYLGGTLVDAGQSIKVDSSGNAYVTGFTFSTDFPLHVPLQGVNMGAPGVPDAFVAELNATGLALNFSTYLGGSGDDRAFGIALDSSANIYVTGESQSTDFPTSSSPFQASNKGLSDAFLVKYHAGGTSVAYSTLLGGSGVDQANSIAVDSSGDAFVAGFTSSSDFPTSNAVQAAISGSGGGSSCGGSLCPDAFVTELNPLGTALVYSTFLGGNAADFGHGVALDTSGLAYVTGSTSSTNFPVIAGATQGELKGLAGNVFVAKVNSANAPGLVIVPQIVNFGNQTVSVRSAPIPVTIMDAGTDPLSISSETVSNADFVLINNCQGTILPSASCTYSITLTPSATGLETGTVTITDNAVNSPHTFTVQGTGVTAATQVTLAPTSLSFGKETVGSVSSPQNFTITNTGTQVLTINTITSSSPRQPAHSAGQSKSATMQPEARSRFRSPAQALRSSSFLPPPPQPPWWWEQPQPPTPSAPPALRALRGASRSRVRRVRPAPLIPPRSLTGSRAR
ncbi:MAG: hypothetical protein DMG21_21865 [Acidobacteria bacterium]|nr:MAG: hypothetical protein DMG21_21865 [Acidobacteriota bacterium]